ncbi:MAG: energy transducer TonB [Myxococcaceae bacterium]
MSGPPRVVPALALSGLAHAALLGSVLFLGQRPSALRPLALRLVEVATGPAATAAASATTLAAPPAEARAPAHPGPRRPGTRARAASPLEPLEPPAPAPSAVLAADAAPGAAHSPTPGGGAILAAQVAGPAAAGGALGAAAGTASLLGELHRRLAVAAQRCYPAAARRFRLQGEVPVHFCLDGHGVASALRLEGSSGSPLLDRSALECVVPGAEPLAGLEGCFLVPVHFGG